MWLTLDSYTPALRCGTTLPTAWPKSEYLQNHDSCVHVSGLEMVDVTEWVINSMDINRQYYPNVHHNHTYMIPGCSSGWLTATTVLRTVRMFHTMSIKKYYWYNVPSSAPGRVRYGDDSKGEASTWAYPFHTVYSSGGYVEATALTKLLPDTFINMQLQTNALHSSRCLGTKRAADEIGSLVRERIQGRDP
jgi:hypothetical protein